ncbi:MAG: protein kinase [Candidatus Obscuribacterales bacterium]|jgi:serine/threonine protein kinase|nr:protein kinase [Candidatus Obscuribacterales bacterium]
MADQKTESTTEAEKVLSSDSLVGTVFESRFEILSVLGSGGSATAYKANDVLLQRTVALKIIHGFLLSQAKAIERFKLEAKTCTLLTHKNIAKVYASGVASDGRPYMVMDLLEGKTLAQVIKDGGALDLDRFFFLFRQLIDALAYAHSEKVVHRDIKPSNIVVVGSEGNEEAILVDFGIAKIIDQETGQNSTQTGALLGSTAYMSPEQCVAGTIDERSDIYSFGCVMIEALTGKAPYEGESAFNIMYKHLNESVGHLGFLKEMPEAVGAMIGKCLQKKPESRYQNMAELKGDFDKCALLDTSQRQWKQGAKPPATSNVVLVLLAVVVVIGGLSFVYLNQVAPNKRKNIELSAVLPPKPERHDVPAKDVVPPHSVNLLLDRLQKYPDVYDKITILNNWMKKWDGLPPPDDQPYAKAEVRYNLGECYKKINQLDKAAILLQEAVQIDLNRPIFEPSKPLALARVYRLQMKPKETLAFLAETRKRFGPDFERPKYYDPASQFYALEGDCWLDLGNFEKAEEAYNQAAITGDKNPDGRLSYQNGCRQKRIECLVRLGRREEVRQQVHGDLLKAHLQEGLKPFDTYMIACEACSKQGDKELAIEFLSLAEKDSVKNSNYKLDVLNNYKANLQPATIDPPAVYKNALAQADRTSDIHVKLAGLHAASYTLFSRDPKLARQLCDRLNHLMKQHLTVDPDFFWKNASPDYPAFVGWRNDHLLNAGYAKDALAESQFWIDKCRGNPSENLVGFYETEAKAYQYLNRTDDALASNQKALNLLIGDQRVQADIVRSQRTSLALRISNAYLQRVGFLNSVGRWSESEEACRNALAAVATEPFTDGAKSSLYAHLGGILEQERKYPEAEQAFKDMLKWVSYDGRPYSNQTAHEIGLYTGYLIRQKKFDAALPYAQLALKHIKAANGNVAEMPLFRAFWLDLGSICTRLNKLDDAMTNYQLIIANSNKPNLVDSLYRGALRGVAEIYCIKGEFARAVDPLKTFLRTAPGNVRADHYHWLADCYKQLNKPDERMTALKRSVRAGRDMNDRSVQQQSYIKELASLYQERGQTNEANVLLNEAQRLSAH